MTSHRGRFAARIAFVAAVAGGQALCPPAARAQQFDMDVAPPPPPEDEIQADEVPTEAVPPAHAPDQGTFEAQLSAYGRWIDTAEYGRVWVPAGTGPDWQPYTDGRWVDTAWGWSFVSAVPWGWAVHHYGRWGFGVSVGWFWVPGFVWAPAWVSWRYSPGFVCWSPFGPPGFVFGRHWPGWVVVPARRFTRPIVSHRVPWPRAVPIVRSASPVASIGSARASRGAQGGTFRGVPARASPGTARPGGTTRARPGARRSSLTTGNMRARWSSMGAVRSRPFASRGGWKAAGSPLWARAGAPASRGSARRR